VIAFDDSSSDGSYDVLKAYESRFNGRLRVHRLPQSGSAKANFARLIDYVDSDYIFLADADDVWDSKKIEIQLNHMVNQESKWGQSTPILSFSDATIINRFGERISDSYWRFKKMEGREVLSLRSSLVCPPMVGCAMAFNKSLLSSIVPIPVGEVTGHDWWAYLVACSIGIVSSLPERLVHYRIHGNNSSQQRPVGWLPFLRSQRRVERVRRGLGLRFIQARALKSRLVELSAPANVIDQVEMFTDLQHKPAIERKAGLLKGGYLYPDVPRNVATVLLA